VKRSRDDPRRLIVFGVTVFFAGAVVVTLLYFLRTVLLLLYVSMLLAIGFSPAVNWLQHRLAGHQQRIPRWAAILVLYVTGLATIALLLAVLLPQIGRQMAELWQRLPEYAEQLQDTLVSAGLIDRRWTWSEMLQKLPNPGAALGGVVNAVQGVIGVITGTVAILILPFYLLVEAESLQKSFLKLFAPERRPAVARVTRDVTFKVGAWLTGQLLLAAIIGSTAAVGLWILGVPYFWVLGLVAGIGELVPVIGPVIAAVPAIFMGWTVSGQTALLVAIYFLVQQIVENNVLVPRVMSQQVGVSAATVLVAILIGSTLLGITGALLAVPSAAIVQVLFQEFTQDEER
jgi:predicted PurR-regulated permease PerM